MSILLHHLSAKSGHTAYRVANILLSLMLSWAAVDHLVRPKDLADHIRRLGFSALTVLKTVIGGVSIVLPGFASSSSWLRSHGAAARQPYFPTPLQTS